jgi:hypothetical protein
MRAKTMRTRDGMKGGDQHDREEEGEEASQEERKRVLVAI